MVLIFFIGGSGCDELDDFDAGSRETTEETRFFITFDVSM
jgi:hypothetical protein